MQLTTGLVSIFAVAPLLVPYVLALPNPNPVANPNILEDFGNWITGKGQQPKPSPEAAKNAAIFIVGNATQIAKGLGSILDGKTGFDDLGAVIKLKKDGSQLLKNIKDDAKLIVASIPSLPEIAKNAVQTLENVVTDVGKELDEFKDDLENLEELFKNAGQGLAKVREAAAKVACKM